MEHKKYRHRVCDILFFLIFVFGIILINQLLSFLLIPYVNYSRKVQHDILWSDQEYEVVCFGSSESFYAFDAPFASDTLGMKCYNMGTSGTTLNGGVYATFDNVMRYQTPRTVIIVLGITSMTASDQENAVAYVGIEPYMRGFQSKLGYFGRSAFYDDMLGRLFPWSVHHVSTFSEIVENVRNKCSLAYRLFDRNALPNISLIFIGDGFCAQVPGDDNDNVVSYEGFDPNDYKDPENGNFISKEAHFADTNIRTLQKIIRKSQRSGADVLISMAPMTRRQMLMCWNYDSYTLKLRDICNKENATFVDLNYAKPDLYDPQPYEYVDDNHVLIDGARRYTEALCTYMKLESEGKNTDNLFCNSWEEFVDMVDWNGYKGLK